MGFSLIELKKSRWRSRLVGGVLWATLGPYATFLAGSLAAVASIPIVLRLPVPKEPALCEGSPEGTVRPS